MSGKIIRHKSLSYAQQSAIAQSIIPLSIEYDFQAEQELVALCKCGEMIHADCECSATFEQVIAH